MKRLAQALLALLVIQSAAAQDPLLDLLDGRGYDRDAILREYENISGDDNEDAADADVDLPADDSVQETIPKTTPKDGAELTVRANSEDGGLTSPGFRLPPPAPAQGATAGGVSALALVLPLDADGLTALAARRFHEGCVQGLRAVGASLQVDVYVSDGSAASALAAYRQAALAANVVVGPIQKKSVDALLAAHPRASVPTLLLQPGAGANYYVLTVDGGEELRELARYLRATDADIMLVSDNSGISRRHASAFTAAWADAAPISRFYVYEPVKDWQRLFQRLKKRLQREEDAAGDAVNPLVVVAAGGGDFIRRVRSFSPQSYPVFAGSAFFTGEQGSEASFLENLRLLEMPWFVAPDEMTAFETPLIRSYSFLQQRFYALGVDACRIARLSFLWVDGWRFSGASGALTLQQGVFRRRGVLTEYQGGYLLPIEEGQ